VAPQLNDLFGEHTFFLDRRGLNERSQGIQALRDGMYRLCEAFLNEAITSATYEDHIGHLTATLNFIVPIELCAKLNREIVVALSSGNTAFAQREQRELSSNAPTKRQAEDQQSEPSSTNAKPLQQSEPSSTNAKPLEMGTPDQTPELLSSKFTKACLEIGERFAGRLSQQMVTRAIERAEAAKIENVLRRAAQPPQASPTSALIPPGYEMPSPENRYSGSPGQVPPNSAPTVLPK
jgi:hypothetical protein